MGWTHGRHRHAVGNADRDDDAATAGVIERVQRDGTCWLSASTFGGRTVMRISIVGWQTSVDDIERSAEAILAVARADSAELRPAAYRNR